MQTRMIIVFLTVALSSIAAQAEQAIEDGVQYPSQVAGQLSNAGTTQHSDWQCFDQGNLIHCAVATTAISSDCQIKSAASLLRLAWSSTDSAWQTFPLFHERCGHHITWALQRLGSDAWSIRLTETAPNNEDPACLDIKAGTTILDPLENGHVYSCRR